VDYIRPGDSSSEVSLTQMNRIGFVQPSRAPRVPVRNDQGEKVGYIVSVAGRQELHDPSGKAIAKNVRFKKSFVTSRVGACGGSFTPDRGW
jgi:hypothetical protein